MVIQKGIKKGQMVVYAIRKGDFLAYIGATTNFPGRAAQHRRAEGSKSPAYIEWIRANPDAEIIALCVCSSRRDFRIMEGDCIRRLSPKFNRNSPQLPKDELLRRIKQWEDAGLLEKQKPRHSTRIEQLANRQPRTRRPIATWTKDGVIYT